MAKVRKMPQLPCTCHQENNSFYAKLVKTRIIPLNSGYLCNIGISLIKSRNIPLFLLNNVVKFAAKLMV